MTTLIGIWYVSLIKKCIISFQILVIDYSQIIVLTGVHVHTTMEPRVPQDTVPRKWSTEDWIWPQWHQVNTSTTVAVH